MSDVLMVVAIQSIYQDELNGVPTKVFVVGGVTGAFMSDVLMVVAIQSIYQDELNGVPTKVFVGELTRHSHQMC